MTLHVALLRGINVTGRRKVPMAALREALEAHGFADVRTYIQSGNVVFDAPRGDHGPAISRLIAERFGHEDVPVMMRTGAELTAVERAHPFAIRGEDVAHLHVTFLEAKPTRAQIAALAEVDAGREELAIIGREAYLFCPDGYGRAKLTNDLFERKLAMQATTRNLKTVRALAALVAG